MEYQMVRVVLPSAQYEEGLAVLYSEGCLGIEELDDGIKAYFPPDKSLAELMGRLKAGLGDGAVGVGKNFVLDASVFRAGKYDPFEFVEGVWIVPPDDLRDHPLPDPPPSRGREKKSRERENSGNIEIMIRPGMGFGTGRDETTRLAGANYLEINKGVVSVLDVGCGSGILGMMAVKLGAGRVEAVEIDPDARENARENFSLNGITSIGLYENIAEAPGPYDCVIANIITPTILELAEDLERRLAPGGCLVLSGILKTEKKQILERFKSFHMVSELSSKEWISLRFSKIA
ncbi:MAG: 50S ribosomal protein L11 methyltransferase [Deltaproteobacteria bacterium]|nr:50S ribosomal protein L11 methyltransferase [Deltaproteobacteria bacterium]